MKTKNTLRIPKLSFTGKMISSIKNLGYTYTKYSYARGDLNFFQGTGKSNWLIQECSPLESVRAYPTPPPANLDIRISNNTDSSTATSSLVKLIPRHVTQKPMLLNRNSTNLSFA